MGSNDIQGQVTDSNGTAVSGAVVTLHEHGGSKLASTTTDGSGNYIFDGTDIVGAGPWHVTARWDDGSGNEFNTLSKPYVSATITPEVPPGATVVSDFEGNNISTDPDWSSWSKNTGGGSLTAQSGTVLSEAYSGEFSENNDFLAYETTTGTDYTGPLGCLMRLDTQSGSTGDYLRFQPRDGGSDLGYIDLRGDGSMRFQNDEMDIELRSWQADTTYFVVMRPDFTKRTIEVWVDQYCYGPFPFGESERTRYNSLNYVLQTEGSATAQNAYVDDIFAVQ